MKKARYIVVLLLVLSQLVIPGYGSAAYMSQEKKVSAASDESVFQVIPATEQITITRGEEGGDPVPNEFIHWKKGHENYVLVGDSLSILENLEINIEGQEVDPNSVKDDIFIGIENEEVANESDFIINGLQQGKTLVTVGYQNVGTTFELSVVDQIEKTYTITYSAENADYDEIWIYGYMSESEYWNYVPAAIQKKSLTENTREANITISARELVMYSEFQVMVNTKGVLYKSKLAEGVTSLEVDDSYSKLIFPDKVFQSIDIAQAGNMHWQHPLALTEERTFYLPKDNYHISASYKKDSDANQYYLSAINNFEADMAEENVSFSEEELMPFSIKYTGAHNDIYGNLYSQSSFSLPNVKSSNTYFTAPGTYGLSLDVLVNDSPEMDGYRISMSNSHIEILEDTEIEASPKFTTRLRLKSAYTAGEFIGFEDPNEELTFINSEGFNLNNLYNHSAGKSIAPVVTMTNIEDPNEVYTMKLSNFYNPGFLVPQTEGTFDVKVSVPLNQEEENPDPALLNLISSSSELNLSVLESKKLIITANYSNGLTKDVTSQAVFNTTNMEVATVTADGLVKAEGPGNASIEVYYEGRNISIPIIVQEDPVEEIEPVAISAGQDRYSLKVGEQLPLLITADFEDGRTLDITQEAFFESSNEAVAIIHNGAITPLTSGEAIITVQYKNVNTTIHVTVYKEDAEDQIKSISFNQAQFDLIHYNESAFSVTAHYESGKSEVITSKAAFQISQSKVADIVNGKLKALSPGTAVIKAAFKGHQAETAVKVVPYLLKLQSSMMSFELEKGTSTQLSVEAVYSDRTTKNVTEAAAFQSSSQSIATVSDSGAVTGSAEGQVTIKATFEGKELTFKGEVFSDETGFELTVKDSNTKGVIDQPKIMVQEYESDDLKDISQKSSGNFKEEKEPGLYEVFVYKQGYMPVLEQVLVENGKLTGKEILLEKSELIKADFSASRMDETEMSAAGIDPEDPNNRWTYRFEAHLAFRGENIPLIYYGNSKGTLYGQPANLGGGYYFYPYLISTGDHEDEQVMPMFAYMIVPGEVSWMKEFFKAQLTIQNLSPVPFSIKNSAISLDLPEGLSLADTFESQSLQVDIGEIEGGEIIHHEWYIRGDQKGEYHLKAAFEGALYPFNEPVRGEFTTKNPIKVWGDDALKMIINSEGTAKAGMPYKVQVRLENVSDAPFYYLNFRLFNEGKMNYFYSPNTQMEYSFNQLAAGEDIELNFLLIPRISGNLDLAHSFILKTGGNAQIETIINSD